MMVEVMKSGLGVGTNNLLVAANKFVFWCGRDIKMNPSGRRQPG